MSDETKITPLDSEEILDQADELLDNVHFIGGELRTAKNRRDFASIAYTIAEDRYSAGSSAAYATIYILVTHGFEAAKAFAEDLVHHEGS